MRLWKTRKVLIGGRIYSNLLYTDDVALLDEFIEERQIFLDEIRYSNEKMDCVSTLRGGNWWLEVMTLKVYALISVLVNGVLVDKFNQHSYLNFLVNDACDDSPEIARKCLFHLSRRKGYAPEDKILIVVVTGVSDCGIWMWN